MTMRKDASDLRVEGGRFYYAYPFDKDRQTIDCRSTEDGFLIWTMTKLPKAVCNLDEDRHTLYLDDGKFRSDEPISAVIQSGSIFVLLFRDTRISSAPSQIRCITGKGTVCWERPSNYYNIWPIADSALVGASSGSTQYQLRAENGEEVTAAQAR